MATYDDLAGLGGVRPRLRQDAVFLRSDGGAYLRSNDTAFFLRGQRAYRWVSTLGPYLNGEHSVADLCDGLDAQHRDTVLGVVRALLDRGFATDVPAVPAGQLDDGVAARFGRQLAYLQHVCGDGGPSGLAAVRAATVHVVGSGALARTAALALVRNGVGTVELLALDDPTGHTAELADAVAELAAAGVTAAATARRYAAGGSPDVLLWCAGPGELSTLPMGALDTPLVPVVVAGGTAVLGPVTRPGTAPCWLCAQLRLAAMGDPAAAADLWRELALGSPVRPRPAGAGSPSAVLAGMLGTAAAFEVFRLLAGLPTELTGGAVVQDTTTLESSQQRLFAHPACPRCRGLAAPEAALVAVADDTDEARYERLSVLVGGGLRVFGRFTDDTISQAPLKVAGIAVHSPAAHHGGRRELLAFDDTSVLRARIAVIGAAVLDYVGQLPDRDDVVTGTADELTAAGHRVLRPAALLTSSGTESLVRHWVPARSLCSGDTALVPLAAGYPLSAANADRVVEPAPVGAAVGACTDELVTAGLTGAMAYRGLRDALRGGSDGSDGSGGSAPRLLDEDAATATDEVLTLLKGLRHLGHPVTVHDLPGAAPAHAVLAVVPLPDRRPLWAVGHGLDQPAAVAMALRELLGRLQVSVDAVTGDPLMPDLDPTTLLPAVPDAMGHNETRPVPHPVDQALDAMDHTETRPATSRGALLRVLVDGGWDALLVDTTTRDVRAAAALVAGVVLLAEDGDRAEGTRTGEGG